MEITKPSITRLARKAGVKSISEECFPYIRALLEQRAKEVIRNALIITTTKTLMPEDIYESLALTGVNLTQSNDLGTTTLAK